MKGDSQMDIKDILPDVKEDYVFDCCGNKRYLDELRFLAASKRCTWSDMYKQLDPVQKHFSELFQNVDDVYVALLARKMFRRGVEYALEAMKNEANNNFDEKK
jgi:hypothetical protein